MLCVICRAEPASVSLLCEACRDDVAAPLGLLPQQVLGTNARPTDDALVDQWGQPHRLEVSTKIGRAIEGLGILILDASISRHHATLTRGTIGWQLADLGSSNGTFLNEAQVVAPVAVTHGDRIEIGAVGFYLVVGLGDQAAAPVHPSVITTIQAVGRLKHKQIDDALDVATTLETALDAIPTFIEREDTDVGLPVVPMRIIEPTGGGGGVLEIGYISIQLSANQIELMVLLERRMRDEAHQPSKVRGFVRSSELIGSLSWDSRDPDDQHLKQLVRRARRQLIRAGVGDVIESRQRFGYRLRLVPG